MIDGLRAHRAIAGLGGASAALLLAAGGAFLASHNAAPAAGQTTTQTGPEAVQFGLTPGSCDQRISTLAITNLLGDKVDATAGACLPVASAAHESVETWKLQDGSTFAVQVSDESAFGLSPHNPASLSNDYWVMMSQIDAIDRVSAADQLSVSTAAGTMTGAVVHLGENTEAIAQAGNVQIMVEGKSADMPSPSQIADFLGNVANDAFNPVPALQALQGANVG